MFPINTIVKPKPKIFWEIPVEPNPWLSDSADEWLHAMNNNEIAVVVSEETWKIGDRITLIKVAGTWGVGFINLHFVDAITT